MQEVLKLIFCSSVFVSAFLPLASAESETPAAPPTATPAAAPVAATAGLSSRLRQVSSGRTYLQIDAGDSRLDFELQRPSQKNANFLLCIPAAFTSQDGGLCGLFASRGLVGNENLVDRKIGGAIKMDGGKAKIFDTKSGADLNSEFVAKLRSERSSFFQQFQIVKDGQAEGFRDKSHFQRRCVALLKDGGAAVIESTADVTFGEFGQDLVELGVQDAVYTDMGPWSEGWYRDLKGRRISIGESRMMTDKQTNWFVLKRN